MTSLVEATRIRAILRGDFIGEEVRDWNELQKLLIVSGVATCGPWNSSYIRAKVYYSNKTVRTCASVTLLVGYAGEQDCSHL
jgi:hypothetical protein